MGKSLRGKWISYLFVMMVTAALCLLLLLAGAFLPQSLVNSHIRESAAQLVSEKEGFRILDHEDPSMLDIHTESVILMEAENMNADNLSSILTNPYDYDPDSYSFSETFYRHTMGEEFEKVLYVRYWLGFRPIVRLLLCFFNYFEIRRYMAFAFFMLFICDVFSMIRHGEMRGAFLFSLSMMMIRPQVVCHTFQSSMCFFIVFFALLFVPKLSRNLRYEGAFFLVLGMLTMYFDFYTTPVITLGMPLIYLMLLKKRENVQASVSGCLKDSGLWLLGYASMWVIKLALTTALTPVNGFENGLESFSRRMGIVKSPELMQYYSIGFALKEVLRMVTIDWMGAVLYGAVIVIGAAVLLYMQKRGTFSFSRMFQNPVFAVIALLPILWFVAAAQPTAIHAYFQYRGVIVLFWGIGVWVSMGFIRDVHVRLEYTGQTEK